MVGDALIGVANHAADSKLIGSGGVEPGGERIPGPVRGGVRGTDGLHDVLKSEAVAIIRERCAVILADDGLAALS